MLNITEVPFNRLVGIRTASNPAQLLCLPSGERYSNHLGTVHAGALLTLAESASAEFLIRRFGPREDVVPVVRRVEAKFRQPARGSITSTASAAPEILSRLDADLAAKGRALLAVTVELSDDAGARVLSATVEWFIQRLDPVPQGT